MATEPDIILPTDLRRIDEKADRPSEDLLRTRVTGVEDESTGVHRRMDRFERLDVTEAQR